MSRIIDENDTASHLKPGHTKPITDQDKCSDSEHTALLQSSKTIDEHGIVDIPENKALAVPSESRILIDDNKKETDKTYQPSKIAIQLKTLLPNICTFLVVTVIFGPICYILLSKNGSSKFVNLNVNFDLLSIETTSGKIPWIHLDTNFVVLEGNGTMICVLQPGSYSIGVMLNLNNRQNKDDVTVSVCILNSRDMNGNRCIPEVLPAHMQRTMTASVNLNLQKGDTIWVSVIGLNLVYQRSDVNSMSIRKYDT